MLIGNFNNNITLSDKKVLDTKIGNVISGTANKNAPKQIRNIKKSCTVYLSLILLWINATPVDKHKIENMPPSTNHSQDIFIDCRKNNKMKKK